MTSGGDEQGPRRESARNGGAASPAPDLAERVRELEQRLASLEAAGRGRDEFIAVMGHELRTPLTPMLAAVQMLRDEPLGERARRYVDVIARNLEAQSRLIDDVVDLSRLQRRGIGLELAPADLGAIVERATSAAAAAARRRRVEVKHGAPGDAVAVRADAARLEQALHHLLDNAVKFSPDGGRIEVEVEADGSRARVRIADHGCGIAPERLPTLFDPFGRDSAGGRRAGLGIGLTLARGIVEGHGGALAVESGGIDHGTTVTVSLPVAPALAAAPKRELEGPARILLVDDHEDSLTLTKMMLEKRGYVVETARCVGEALDLGGRERFDALVTDIGLPDESGLTILPELRKRGAIVGIAVSGFGRDVDIQRSKEAGYAEHLTKPVSIQRLHELLQGLVGRTEAP